jgi:hypothetical protein
MIIVLAGNRCQQHDRGLRRHLLQDLCDARIRGLEDAFDGIARGRRQPRVVMGVIDVVQPPAEMPGPAAVVPSDEEQVPGGGRASASVWVCPCARH